MDILGEDDEWQGGVLLGSAVEFKVISDASEAGLVEGYGATFGGIDSQADTIAPGAFLASLGRHKEAGTAPAMLWHHRMSEPVGRWTGMGEDSRGLRVRGQLNLETAAGRKSHAHLRAGDISGLSIGYTVPKGGSTAGGAGGRTLRRVDLHEVSVVAIPSDGGSRILSVKSLGSRAELEDLLRDTGLPRAAARKLAAGGWPALSGADPDESNPTDFELLLKHIDKRTLELRSLKGTSR